jgi:hypothetical protein
MRRSTLVAAAGMVLLFPPAAIVHAQDACFLAHPAPRCNVFVFTNAGGYVRPTGGLDPGASRFRVMVDWGIAANVTPRHAIGASWFVTLDEDEFTTGPVIRYRHWFDDRRSLDVAFGTPIAGREVRTGSLLGLVKYNPVNWFGVGVRPEFVRHRAFACTPGPGCTEYTVNSTRVYAGLEVGEYPGLGLSLAGLAALGLLALAFSGVD